MNIKIGDFVRVQGEGAEVFKVEYITNTSVGLHTGVSESIEKCTKVDLNKFRIFKYIVYYAGKK
uniref:Uncharacterized protein n=1 Tax=viral metagenome TaxID=1070528 RepID=A0A6M3XPX7_9ZZZZ